MNSKEEKPILISPLLGTGVPKITDSNSSVQEHGTRRPIVGEDGQMVIELSDDFDLAQKTYED